ncbi:MAG TPA: hypothetical protein VMW01_16635 [Williamwhitmania sp.]|nr:hypothetical protein [Williamwhitmania sp.]
MRGLQPFPTIAKGLKPYIIFPAFPNPRPEYTRKIRLAIAAPQLKKILPQTQLFLTFT